MVSPQNPEEQPILTVLPPFLGPWRGKLLDKALATPVTSPSLLRNPLRLNISAQLTLALAL